MHVCNYYECDTFTQDMKIPDAILHDNTTIRGNATVLDQVLNLNAVVVPATSASSGASNASAMHCKTIVLVVLATMHYKHPFSGKSALQIPFSFLKKFVMQFRLCVRYFCNAYLQPWYSQRC